MDGYQLKKPILAEVPGESFNEQVVSLFTIAIRRGSDATSSAAPIPVAQGARSVECIAKGIGNADSDHRAGQHERGAHSVRQMPRYG
jgi:hypothetical protein